MSRYVSVVFLIICLVEQTASITGNFICHVIGNPFFCILINLRKSRGSAVLPQRKLINIFAFSCKASIIYLSRVMRKPGFCICENKDADQLRGNREADQRLCFRYLDSTIPPLPKSEISSL